MATAPKIFGKFGVCLNAMTVRPAESCIVAQEKKKIRERLLQ